MSTPQRIEELPEDIAGTFGIILALLPQLHPKTRPFAVHAIRHLRKAWRIREADPEMAMLRAITAEEEAASALIRSLRRIGYRGARYLDPEKHTTKVSIWPMILALSRWMARTKPFTPHLVLVGEGAEAELHTHLELLDERGDPRRWPNGEPMWVVSEFPLDMSARGNGELATFTDEFAALATEAETASVEAYIRKRADARKPLLYATENGIYQMVDDSHKRLKGLTVSTRALLFALVMVDPHPVQSFAQQVVDAVVDALQPILPPRARTIRRARALETLPVYERYCRKCKAPKLGLAKTCPQCREKLHGWKITGVQFRDAERVVHARPLQPDERWEEIEAPEST
jgi:hypothetical protein